MNETSRAKRLIKLLERLLKKRELYDEDKLKFDFKIFSILLLIILV